MKKDTNYKTKLGMFIVFGLALFVVTIYFLGKSKNLFGSTFQMKSYFKNVSGLKEGGNVRFSGITVGTVKNIEFVSDSLVVVYMMVNEDVQKYIKTDAVASIGSDGLMGDKILSISPGANSNKTVQDNATIKSSAAIEMDDLMKGFKKSVDHAEVITAELAVFTKNMNNSNGALSKLMTDPKFSGSIQATMLNLEQFTAKMNNKNNVLSKLVSDEELGKSVDSTIIGINETVEAAKQNFLLKGYFNKKKKAEAKKKKAEAKKKEDSLKK